MNLKLLLTGRPGTGKTTAIKRVLAAFPDQFAGIYTEEIREHGVRVGFRMCDLDGNVGILAHLDYARTMPRVAAYGVDVGVVDQIGTAAVRRALESNRALVIDELAPMEFYSPAFVAIIHEAFASPLDLLAGIVYRRDRVADAIKARDGVEVLTLTVPTRAQLTDLLLHRFAARFTLLNNTLS
ncbi:MAG: AAA family ATPase [Anaerolineae bacterium]|nr:AAA family ATPase [Anaerolineae bacterium]